MFPVKVGRKRKVEVSRRLHSWKVIMISPIMTGTEVPSSTPFVFTPHSTASSWLWPCWPITAPDPPPGTRLHTHRNGSVTKAVFPLEAFLGELLLPLLLPSCSTQAARHAGISNFSASRDLPSNSTDCFSDPDWHSSAEPARFDPLPLYTEPPVRPLQTFFPDPPVFSKA